MGCRTRAPLLAGWLLTVAVFQALPSAAAAQARMPLVVRGRTIALRTYGPSSGAPVVVASGDGGWVHLGPQVAALLAGAGYRVLGLDSRQYLEAFTSGSATLEPEDVRRDFGQVAAVAAQGGVAKPILIGVSEGAGLCVLAASDGAVQAAIRGVIALGLPDVNELGWRWRDAVIYLTKGVPREPTFSVSGIIGRVSPLPLAAIHSTGDEFVPVAVVQRLIALAQPPKRLWLVEASNHRFSGNEGEFRRRLLEAVAWVEAPGR